MSTMMKTRSETDDEDAWIQRQKKQTRRPVSKIGRDRNHSGVVGTQFRPSPAGLNQEVMDGNVSEPFPSAK